MHMHIHACMWKKVRVLSSYVKGWMIFIESAKIKKPKHETSFEFIKGILLLDTTDVNKGKCYSNNESDPESFSGSGFPMILDPSFVLAPSLTLIPHSS